MRKRPSRGPRRQHNDSRTKVSYDNITYALNSTEMTARVIESRNATGSIIIPRAIKHESREYKVIGISEESFMFSKIKSIQFPPDSEVQTIEQNAFYKSSIEKLSIPPNLTKLQDEWCSNTIHLNSIEISSENPNYKFYDDKFILGKTSNNSEDFDVLIFCIRNLQKVIIPDFIKTIGPFAFDECADIKTIEISNDSQLKTIEKKAFYHARIDRFTIPPHLTKICNYAFSCCSLQKGFEIPENSELETIEDGTFTFSEIEKFTIPPHLTKINRKVFFCSRLKEIVIPSDSRLKTIEKSAFCESDIESLSIPSNLIDLKDGWCSKTYVLNSINVSPNNPCYKIYQNSFILGKTVKESDDFDVLLFCVRNINIKKLTIPNFIKKIGPYAFEQCFNLQSVEFTCDSKVEIIGRKAFSQTNIAKITIPSQVTQICDKAFYDSRIKKIDFCHKSQLKKIGNSAFQRTPIKSFSFPHHIEIGHSILHECDDLLIVEIDEIEKISEIDEFDEVNGIFILSNCIQIMDLKKAIIMIPVISGNK